MKNPIAPRIIPRSGHPISRSLISPNALKTLYRLKDSGHIAYLVGGCVRDLLLGREPKDFDVVTDATPGRVKRLFRNCRLVGRRFRLAHLHFSDEIIEVSTFRSNTPGHAEESFPNRSAGREGAPEPLRAPRHLVSEEGVVLRDNVFGSPAEDSLRRDFTVNALAYDIADFSIIDFVGGMEDLERGVVRTIGDPSVRFTEDPVRMLRAVRFAAILGFAIDQDTWRALEANAATITLATAPRLYEEVLKLFLSGEAEQIYQIMRRAGIFSPLFPGLAEWLDRESDNFPHVRLGRDLEWIDRRVSSGEPVSSPLLLALMFGEFLEERALFLKEEGLNAQEAMSAAVAGFLGEQSALVAIPHRIGLAVRDILALQGRLQKMPGKRPQSVILRTAFRDALAYLRCRCEVMGEEDTVPAWWERYARENVMPPSETRGKVPTAPAPRKRKRKRRRRSPGGSPEKIPAGPE